MFVGHSPMSLQDEMGSIGAGPISSILRKMIQSAGIDAAGVFFSNLIRCHPPPDRRPTLREISTCKQFLKHEIAIVRPAVLVTLGIIPTRFLLATADPLVRLRGKFHDFHGIRVMPTFHPLEQFRDTWRQTDSLEDMKKVRDYLADHR
jgi:uracil-DNA glycosylase